MDESIIDEIFFDVEDYAENVWYLLFFVKFASPHIAVEKIAGGVI